MSTTSVHQHQHNHHHHQHAQPYLTSNRPAPIHTKSSPPAFNESHAAALDNARHLIDNSAPFDPRQSTAARGTMDRQGAGEYGNQGHQPPPQQPRPPITPSSYNAAYGDSQAESSQVDHHSSSQYQSSSSQATPTSDYSVYPQSARSSTFPDHIRGATYHPGAAATTAPSPTTYQTYPPSPYTTGPVAYHHQDSGPAMYGRPEWAGYNHGAGMSSHMYPGPRPTHQVSHQVGHQIYSFVPIPGSAQHKRPRRRYEEIERMYKCGFNGCEKAYGTLNHLNAHVTMQSHGPKRTPEEFKEIRKEWRERKKLQEKALREREQAHRQAQADAAAAVAAGQAPSGPETAHADDGAQVHNSFATQRPTLPPLGHQGQYAAGPSSAPLQQPIEYAQGQMYPGYATQNPPAAYPPQYNQSPAPQQPPHSG